MQWGSKLKNHLESMSEYRLQTYHISIMNQIRFDYTLYGLWSTLYVGRGGSPRLNDSWTLSKNGMGVEGRQTCLLYASPMWHLGTGQIMYIGLQHWVLWAILADVFLCFSACFLWCLIIFWLHWDQMWQKSIYHPCLLMDLNVGLVFRSGQVWQHKLKQGKIVNPWGVSKGCR